MQNICLQININRMQNICLQISLKLKKMEVIEYRNCCVTTCLAVPSFCMSCERNITFGCNHLCAIHPVKQTCSLCDFSYVDKFVAHTNNNLIINHYVNKHPSALLLKSKMECLQSFCIFPDPIIMLFVQSPLLNVNYVKSCNNLYDKENFPSKNFYIKIND